MKTILKIIFIVILGLLVYNFFYGDEKEKETSAQVVDQARQLGQSVWEMIKIEKDRFSDGKHQEILDNLGSTIGFLKNNRESLNISDGQIADIDQHMGELDSLLLLGEQDVDGEKQLSEEAKEKLRLLLNKVESLIEDN